MKHSYPSKINQVFRHLGSALVLILISFYSNSQCNLNFSLGNDTVIDCGSSVTLSAPSGLDGYTWNNGSHNQTITVSQSGNFWCTGTQILTNIVTNGDFSGGATGFSSNYTPGTGGTYGTLTNEGQYAVTSNPSLVHTNYASCYDHTVGTAAGSMLVVNGSAIAGQSIWEQTVTVQPNTSYTFVAWGMSVVSANPAQLAFSINGTQIGSTFTLSSTTCNWQQFSATWNSGTNTTATIAIVNQNTATGGNDFAIDDITFADLCQYTDTINVSYPDPPILTITGADTICEGDSITLTASTDIPGSTVVWFPNLVTADSIRVSPSTTTTYSAVANSPQNCNSSMVSTVITVLPYPEINASANDTICVGDSSTISFTSQNIDQFTWENGNTTDTTRIVSPSQTTTYSITGFSSAGCSSTDSVSIVVNEIPTVSFEDNYKICAGDSITVYIDYDNSTATNIYWDSKLDNVNQKLVTTENDTSLNVFIEQNGCYSDTAYTDVITQEIPVTYPISDVVTCPETEFELETSSSVDEATIVWLPDNITGNYYSNLSSESYEIAAFSFIGECVSDTVYAEILISDTCQCEWNIPNVFTPNGDDLNDAFMFVDEKQSCILRNFRLVVFNRWGKTIWETNDQNIVWDGTNNGNMSAEGTYFWKLSFSTQNNDQVTETGTVTLLK